MAAEDLREQVLQILAEVTGCEAVRSEPDLALFDSGLLDSLGTVTLMAAFEERFGIRISPADFDRSAWATPRRIVEDVAARVAS